jgi:hypothetical protein
VPAILEDGDINDEEFMEYLYPHGTASLNDKKAGMPYTVPCDAAEQMIVKSVTALAPLEEDEEAQTWSGADWLRLPAWALRGASLYSVIFRPELYVCLEHGDDACVAHLSPGFQPPQRFRRSILERTDR